MSGFESQRRLNLESTSRLIGRAFPRVHQSGVRSGDTGGKPDHIDMGAHQLAKAVVAVVTLTRLDGGLSVASLQFLQCVHCVPSVCFDYGVKVNRDEFFLPNAAFLNEEFVQLAIR